jgi:hypothetical protein
LNSEVKVQVSVAPKSTAPSGDFALLRTGVVVLGDGESFFDLEVDIFNDELAEDPDEWMEEFTFYSDGSLKDATLSCLELLSLSESFCEFDFKREGRSSWP